MSQPVAAPSKRTVFLRRSASTIGLWAVVTAAFASRLAWAYVALIGALVILSVVEYFRMLRAGGVAAFPCFGILLSLVYSGVLYWTLAGLGKPLPAAFDAAFVFLATAGAFALQLRRPVHGKEPLVAVAATVLGFVYVPVLFNFCARIVFAAPGAGEVPGAMALLWMIAVTKFTDMGAYLTGSLMGKHKMIPHVSPGKTWEGFAGALGFALLAGCGLYAAFHDDVPGFATGLHLLGGWPHVIGLTLVLSLLAVVGDLAESLVKRSLEVKDSGQMLPGIGGGLDLIDSLCFTAPALYFYLTWIAR